jgi:aspartate racemase
MKKIGIIGGIGPESTIDYYRGIISRYREKTGNDNYPVIFINSINMTEMLLYLSNRNYEELISLLVRSIGELARAGADFAAIASNTPHLVFDEVSALSPLPLISIVEETGAAAQSLGIRKALLVGTAFTMGSSFYRDCFSRRSISMLVPSAEEQERIHGIIFPELEEGIVIPEKKAALLGICNRIIAHERVDGVVLGCTELPLMVRDGDLAVTVLNTSQIHIEAIVSRLVQEQ